MKIKITPSLKRTPPGISNLPHLSQLTIQSLRSNAFRLAGCVYEISKWTLDTCFLPDSGEVLWADVTEVIDPTPENVEFCKQYVERLHPRHITKTTRELNQIVKHGISIPVEEMWESGTLHELFKSESLIVWVYTFVRDNQHLFTK